MGKHSRTPLDGVFAYLVQYKGEHVMTLGFSIINDRQILLQQVQLKNRTGNRWLFRFPENRLEFIIDKFRSAFRGYRIHIVDGKSTRSEEHTSELQSLMRISYAVFCLKKKNNKITKDKPTKHQETQ